mmetsp:Transcript_13929/g.47138  ORF Transcript_13929/g.47138 Transcript_13929/m.47138 type:complete len:432 (+) Transcript_13929:364-1659(+)
MPPVASHRAPAAPRHHGAGSAGPSRASLPPRPSLADVHPDVFELREGEAVAHRGLHKEGAQELAVVAEERDARGHLVPGALALLLEGRVGLLGEPLPLEAVVEEGLDLELKEAPVPLKDRLEALPARRGLARGPQVVLHLDEGEGQGVVHGPVDGQAAQLVPAEPQPPDVVLQRPCLLGRPHHQLDTEHVLHVVAQVRELLVREGQVPDEAVKVEDLVAHLIEDLLLGLDARYHLVNRPLPLFLRLPFALPLRGRRLARPAVCGGKVVHRLHGRGVVLHEGGHQGGLHPLAVGEHAVLGEDAVAQGEVRLRAQRGRLHALRELKPVVCARELADDHALRVVAPEEPLAEEGAELVLFALPLSQGPLELGPRALDEGPREAERVRAVRVVLDHHALVLQVGDELRDGLRVGDHAQRGALGALEALGEGAPPV